MLRIIYATMGTAPIALICSWIPMAAAAHGGGVDGVGCHNDNKHGGYHCHRGPLAYFAFNTLDRVKQEFARGWFYFSGREGAIF